MTLTGIPERPNRRLTDGTRLDTPRARQNRLVRVIASDPVLVQWLATTKARTLHEVAASLATLGHHDAAEVVRRRADSLGAGDASPF